MRNSRTLAACATVLILSAAASGQIKYETYSNARFAYSIDYPSSLMVAHEEAPNADGRVFSAKKGIAELRVWGQSNALADSLRKAYLSDLKERPAGVTHKTLLKDSYVISGARNGKIFYQRTILSGADGDVSATFATFLLEYDSKDKARFDAAVTKISRSFKFE
ncbi:MAG: hypothetical protein ABJA02_14585 [Acidobacteriota bacterium]